MTILSRAETEEILNIRRSNLSIDEERIFFRSLAFWDWAFWIEVICERWTVEKKTGVQHESADFHFELWKNYFSGEDTLSIVGRAQAKTTNVSKMATSYALCFGLEPSILLIATRALGEEIIGDIREELEANELIQFIFGDLVPKSSAAAKGKKWRGRELQLLNGSEIKSISKNEPIRGKRPTKIIVDDPEENSDVKNPKIAREFYYWMFTAVYPALADGGSMFVLGTMIGKICFVNQLKQQHKIKGFKLIEYPAILDFDSKKDIKFIQEADRVRVVFTAGRPLWPQRWTLEKLAERCQKMLEDGNNISIFLQEYCNIPFTLNSSPVFSADYIYQVLKPERIYSEFKIHEYRKIDPKIQYSLGVDVAKGGLKGDYTTVSLRGFNFKMYRQYKGHITQDRLPFVIDEMVKDLPEGSFTIVVEANYASAFFLAARESFWFSSLWKRKIIDKATQRETEDLGFMTTAKSKIFLINCAQKIYQTGDTEVSQELKEEIENFMHNERGGMEAAHPYHDDLVISDALSLYGIQNGIPDNMPTFI